MHIAPTIPTFRPPTTRSDLVRHGLDRFRRLAVCMVTEGPMPLRGLLSCLSERLTTIHAIEVRLFVGVAARHIRATLLELALQTASPSYEWREWVRVHQEVGGLPGHQQELFDLLLYWGMKESEVASLLGMSPGGVRVCWNQARLALQRVLRQEQGLTL